MTGFCTCGTRLVEDALFCHRCGRPTRDLSARDEPAVETAPVEAAPAGPKPPPLPAVHEINFHNRMAVKTAMLMAMMVSMMLFMPFGGIVRTLASFLVLPAAGFGAVYLYHRRTGAFLSVGSGARMGWLTGLFIFLIALVMLSLMIIALTNDEIRESVRQQVYAAGAEINFDEFVANLQSPQLFGALFVLFLFFTALPMIGGALGAKVLERE
ncbi:MAG: zinc ribbon domain-containing protein [Bryobacterales bacterium]|nr:zinc ribbon domain-containing protein [Bryobacterales bacterium]